MKKIAILGTGAWGTALGNILIKNNNDVFFWGIDENEINDLKNGFNKKYFDEKPLFSKLKATNNEKEIIDFNPDFILVAVPSPYIEDVLSKFINFIKTKPIVINVAKGFNPKTNSIWSEGIKKIINNKSKGLVTLIGPSFAIEVFKNEPTIVNAVSENLEIANEVIKIFNNNSFKAVYLQDEKGSEVLGALKNVMAIGLGISFTQHTSINTRAAILTQAVKEIFSIIKIFNGEIESLINFCGIGDIYLTCTDDKSRNFSFGRKIAEVGFENAMKANTKTVEGYRATLIAKYLVDNNNIKAPVFEEIYNVLYKNSDVNLFTKNIIKKII